MERLRADGAGGRREFGAEVGGRAQSLVGPYVLLAEIARGELATVHLAKKQSALGFQRLYALKRLRPALSGSAEHGELLLDEARVMSSIRHANIVGAIDVGTDAGSYVVMEYVEGENLESLLMRAGSAREARYVVPPLVDALHGLHALHTATEGGEPRSIVHQAPRARHVLVGVDGSARLIDFSQVRAASVRSSRCRSDRLKVASMAPEMALHPDGVDLRADLFVLGVALWEALTGERLFAGDNDDHTFQNMLHRRIPPPSEVGLKPPRCFDAMCMRALERDRGKRYDSALEMALDLREAASRQGFYASPEEVGAWVRELAGPELRERRRRAGIDAPSPAGASLEAPAPGFERRALSDAAAEGAPGHSEAAVAASAGAPAPDARQVPGGSDESALTPPVGMRRALALRAEVGDDEPTGRRSSLPAPSRADLGARSPPLQQGEDLARAVTLPMVARASPSDVRSAPAPRAAAGRPPPDADVDDERDPTQPNRFVPARPGARRDARTASPGAYSQVDGRRGRGSEVPEGGGGLGFDDVVTTARPGLASRAAQRAPAAPERASALAADAQRSRVSPLPARRPITEMPPTYVQRRDSNPTRMQIPDGPVGAPHRSFPQDEISSDVHRLPPPLPVQPRYADDGDEPTGPEDARDQSRPRVRRSDLAVLQQLGMVDSLSPPSAALLTTPPAPRAAAGRSWPLWLATGVLTAIIVLAVGVGVRQWVAGPSRALPSTRQAGAAAREAPPRAPPAARRGAEPGGFADSPPAPASPAARRGAVPDAVADSPPASPAARQPAEPVSSAAARPPPAAAAGSAPAPAASSAPAPRVRSAGPGRRSLRAAPAMAKQRVGARAHPAAHRAPLPEPAGAPPERPRATPARTAPAVDLPDNPY